ncbi:MAG: HEAT repeat domain-containing protein [Chloroflexi bacterium]|nr:HEAT repeat domain-containing protein [Chloroflexota bacterium]
MEEQRFAHAVDALGQPGELPAESLGALSHLVSHDLEAVERTWRGLAPERRREVLTQLARSERANPRQDFNAIYGIALADVDPSVRRLAVEAIHEENGPALLDALVRCADEDPDPNVREAACAHLAPFALQAELGELPDRWRPTLRAFLLSTLDDDGAPLGVRREALAALGYLDDAEIAARIERASHDDALRLWAIRAMGRTANPDWLDTLTRESTDDDPSVRQEVARAFGEIADEQAAAVVADMVDDHSLEVRLAALRSLGQIGGEDAREALIYALEDSRPIIREAAERALNVLEEGEDPLSL